jgi:hypothetical protein
LNNNVQLSDVQKECAKAVFTPIERGKNVLAREAKSEKGKEKEKIKDLGLSR